MKILLLGGTGAIGKPLANQLADRGDDVYITTRSDRISEKENIHYLKGNAHNASFVKSILSSNYNAVVDFMHYDTNEFRSYVNSYLDLTNQYIFISSSRVYANSNNEKITEDTPRLLDVSNDKDFLATNEYSLTKARNEDLLRNSGRSNWTIIRPYITFNSDRLQLGIYEKEVWLYRVCQNKTVVIGEDMLNCLTTMTYGCDVANYLARIVGNSKAFGQVIHITTNQAVRWKNVLDIYSKVLEEKLGRAPKFLYFKDSSELCDTFRWQKYQLIYDRLFNRVFDNSKLFDICGHLEFEDIEKSLTQCVSEFLGNRFFKEISPVIMAKMDRLSHEHSSLKGFTTIKKKIKYIVQRYFPVS